QLAVRNKGAVRAGAPMGIVPVLATTYGSDLTLGWRLHAEELMRELQFRESPAARMVLCDRAAVDGVLAWFDLRLAEGKATPEHATQVLIEKTGLAEPTAKSLIADVIRAPGRAAGAVAGKARLMQLRR